ncbi:hypothetical protein Moror_6655 [Moniliophthora roreri MCA 2997]|uniref:Uncharacterized protein n=1 Tax=Moniliophthora roreri (strain MCA 2997) TaxID=1381753 RepID=V2XC71_MONRO|nr:hypothetical protein Moror_6655 [Moniliophthora roreri MCA 2997]
MSTISDRLRITIALTALKHKPLNQSCASYVLDLQTKFCSTPDSTKSSDSIDPSGPTGTFRTHSHNDNAEQDSDVWRWKSLALRLEEELEELRAKYEAEQIKSLSLTVQVDAKSTSEMTQEPSSSTQPQLQGPSSSAGAANADNTTKKKPAKKNPKSKHPPSTASGATDALVNLIKPRARIHPETISILELEGLNDSQLPGVFSSFSQLMSALPPDTRTITRPQVSLLLSTTIRVLQSVSGVLRTTLFTDADASAKSEKASSRPASPHRLQKVAALLNYLLTMSLPLLRVQPKKKKLRQLSESSENTDVLIDTLATFIMNPMIHSFIPLSENFLDELFRVDDRKDPLSGSRPTSKPTSKKAKPAVPEPPIDLRIPVLNTLRDTFSAVGESYVTPGFRETLSLTVVREILALFDSTIRISPTTSASTSARNSNQTNRDPHVNESDDKEHSSDAKTSQRSAMYDCYCSVHRRGTPAEDPGEESVAVRRKLARKDALWYLCSILHILLKGQDGGIGRGVINKIVHSKNTVTGREDGVDGKEGIRLLREGILDALLGLVSRCQTCSGRGYAQELNSEAKESRNDESMIAPMNIDEGVLDEVQAEKSDKHTPPSALVLDEEEYDMVLAVIEQYYWVLAPIVDERE